MSSSCSVSRSMHSANAAVANKLRPRFVTSCLVLPSFLSNSHNPRKPGASQAPANFFTASSEDLRSRLADALVQAGTCRHGQKSVRRKKELGARQESTLALQRVRETKGKEQRRCEGQQRQIRPARQSPYTREEYMNLLDFYETREQESQAGAGYGDDHDGRHEVPLDSDGSPPPETRLTQRAEIELMNASEDLEHLLNDDEATPEDIFNCYRRLPKPGVQHLGPAVRQSLIRKLSVLRHRNRLRTMQYFSVLDDMKLARIKIPQSAWNSAMHLGGKTMIKVSDAEVEMALQTWKEMEDENGIKGDSATFNILFDIAAKAGKFGLAELIQQEMRSRGLATDRYTRFGRIFAQGLQKNGAGVRKAYREFVESDEIVDTTCLNCVISSLLSCGEPEAARAVFDRMKTLAIEREQLTYEPKLWEKQREFASILRWFGQNRDLPPATRQKVQSITSMAPDVKTCNLLLAHYCETGELQHTVGMLEEMQRLALVPQDGTWRALMQGFSKHGGVRYSTWTGPRLEAVWHAHKALLETRSPGLYLSKWSILYTLMAFRKCCGSEREAEVWQELEELWEQEPAMEEFAPKPSDEHSSWDIFQLLRR